ncbi:MAG: hypothetical protein DMG09_17920 [Acidobacteria bacterium]|nr:MAG: hypothetical protein DMG09_17920 [Acidobacteriota bacterium]
MESPLPHGVFTPIQAGHSAACLAFAARQAARGEQVYDVAHFVESKKSRGPLVRRRETGGQQNDQ